MLILNQKGQGLVEYVIVVALIAVASMGVVRILQQTVKVNLTNVIFALQSDGRRKVSAEKIKESDYKKSDFGDFMNGAASGSGSNNGAADGSHTQD